MTTGRDLKSTTASVFVVAASHPASAARLTSAAVLKTANFVFRRSTGSGHSTLKRLQKKVELVLEQSRFDLAAFATCPAVLTIRLILVREIPSNRPQGRRSNPLACCCTRR
jgi:hypothetical protein